MNKHAEQIWALATKYQVGLVDSYQLFQGVAKKEDLEDYMAQGNHINVMGHALVAHEIMTWFSK